MKKMMNKTIIIVTVLAVFFALAGCSDLTKKDDADTEKNVLSCTVSGKVTVQNALPSEIVSSLIKNSDSSRSATASSFDNAHTCLVRAYHGTLSSDETFIRDDAEFLSGNIDTTNMFWNVNLNQEGSWEIEISLYADSALSDCILTGTTTLFLESLTDSEIEADSIVLKPICKENVTGAIFLEIKNETETVNEVSYSWIKETADTSFPDTLTDGILSFENGKATLSFDSVTTGVYELYLAFNDSYGKTLYSCYEKIPVFSCLTTDTWYGESPYLLELEDKNNNLLTSFTIYDELLECYSVVNVLPSESYPIILWDSDTKLKKYEFDTPKPGYNVFSDIKGNEWIGDGLTLAEGKTISDFTIDSVTQEIYTIENSASMSSSQIVKYPSYAGYSKGKTVALFDTNSVAALCAYSGDIYVYSSNNFFKLKDGSFEKLELQDSSEETITLEEDQNSSSKITVNGKFLYMAYVYGSNSNFSFKIRKFQISDSALKEISTVEKTMENLGIYSEDDNISNPISVGYNNASIAVSDIHVKSDGSEIYVLTYERAYNDTYGGWKSRGGIIRFDDNDSSLTLHDFKEEGESASKYIYGWTYDAYHPSVDSDTNLFYGCTKLIAKKPDELVIADEGGYKYTDEDGATQRVNKNRVVKVNLETFAMSAYEVNTGFDTCVSPTNCQFCGYTGCSY